MRPSGAGAMTVSVDSLWNLAQVCGVALQLLLREVDRRMRLTERVERALGDRRQRVEVDAILPRGEAVVAVPRERPPFPGSCERKATSSPLCPQIQGTSNQESDLRFVSKVLSLRISRSRTPFRIR